MSRIPPKTRARWAAQILTPAAAVALAWFVLVVVLTNGAIGRADDEAELLASEQLALVDELAELTEIETWRDDLEAERQRLEAAVPSTPQLDVLVRALATAAGDAGVVVEQLAPVSVQSAATDGGADLPDGVTAIELSVSVIGDYRDLMAFLQAVQGIDRLVVFDSLSMLSDDEDRTTITLDLLFRVFTLQEAASVAANAEESDAFDLIEDEEVSQ